MSTAPTRLEADSAELPADSLQAIMRLLVGLTLEGYDELSRRLREWETEARQAEHSAGTDKLSEQDRLRYALIGMVFAAGQRAERDLTQWLSAPGRAVDAWRDTLTHLTKNPFLRPVLKPLKARVDDLSATIHDEVERWIRIGQAQESPSRDLARAAIPDVIDEILSHLADNPELRDLIQQQSVGLAEEVVDSVREVTVTADAVLERIVRQLLGRKPAASRLPASIPAAERQNGRKETPR